MDETTWECIIECNLSLHIWESSFHPEFHMNRHNMCVYIDVFQAWYDKLFNVTKWNSATVLNRKYKCHESSCHQHSICRINQQKSRWYTFIEVKQNKSMSYFTPCNIYYTCIYLSTPDKANHMATVAHTLYICMRRGQPIHIGDVL